jgi:hypothetical protein
VSPSQQSRSVRDQSRIDAHTAPRSGFGTAWGRRLRATSLDMVETMKSLEDEFDIEISDRDAETFKAVDDAIALVTNKF